MKNIVHIVGTGTIGEPVIGLFSDFGDRMGIDGVIYRRESDYPDESKSRRDG